MRWGREVSKELSMKIDEEIWGLKESLSNMTLSNYQSEEKVEKLLKNLEVAKNNILDRHKLDFWKALQ